jgi:hypothetical protein
MDEASSVAIAAVSAMEREEFNFKRLASTVNMNHRPPITGFQTLGRQVVCESHTLMFFDHLSTSSGCAVINRGL